ncbi:MAG: hypothetical protein GY750_15880 [Lentisphaerae bacterium]|nr:hypothetical protein [Lentisphaerota bacterium]
MTAFPYELTAGCSQHWEVSFTEYLPTDGWTLRYLIRVSTDRIIELTATPTDDTHTFTLSADALVGVEPAVVKWQCQAIKGDEKYLVASGKVRLHADLSDSNVDPRSYPEKMLEAINAVLAGKLDNPVTETEYNGRRLKYMAPGELIRLRTLFLSMLPQNQGIRTIKVEFKHG